MSNSSEGSHTDDPEEFWRKMVTNGKVDVIFEQVQNVLLCLQKKIKDETATPLEYLQAMKLINEAIPNKRLTFENDAANIDDDVQKNIPCLLASPEDEYADSYSIVTTKSKDSSFSMYETYSEDACRSTALPAKLPFEKHYICNTACLAEMTCGFFRSKNPLKIPIFCRFLRLHAKTNYLSKELDVYYRAPCGRSLRSYQEVQNYLIETQCNFLFLDYFSFNTYLQLDRTDLSRKAIVSDPDISNGVESVPVSFFNDIDSINLPYFKYRKTSWPHGYCVNNFSDMFIDSCSCTDGCNDVSKCPCLQLTVGDCGECSTPLHKVPSGYAYKRLQKPVPSGIFECNISCKCDKMFCQNRVVQHGLRLQLQVFKTQNKGWGVRCLDDIDKGTFVCTYTGRILTRTINREGGLENSAESCIRDNDNDDDQADESFRTLTKRKKMEVSCSDSEIELIHTEEDNKDKRKYKPVSQALKQGKELLDFQKYGYNTRSLCPPSIKRPKSRTAILQNRRKQMMKKGTAKLMQASSEDEDVLLSQQSPKTKLSIRTRRANIITDLVENTEEELSLEEEETATQDELAKSDDQNIIDGSTLLTTKLIVETTERQTEKDGPYKKSGNYSVSQSEAKISSQKSSNNEEHIYLLDATEEGNVGRFLNHSCCPNLFVQNVFVDTHNRSFPWVAFFTISFTLRFHLFCAVSDCRNQDRSFSTLKGLEPEPRHCHCFGILKLEKNLPGITNMKLEACLKKKFHVCVDFRTPFNRHFFAAPATALPCRLVPSDPTTTGGVQQPAMSAKTPRKDRDKQKAGDSKMAAPASPEVTGSPAWVSEVAAEVTAAMELVLEKRLLPLDVKLERVQEKLDTMGQEVSSFHQRVEALDDRVLGAEGLLRNHAKTLAALEDRLEDLENRSRRCNLRFVGLPEELPESDLRSMMESWITSSLTLPPGLGPLCIERAHRLGLKRSMMARPRVVIIKLLNYVHKQAILQAMRGGQNLTYNNKRILCFQDYSAKVSQQRRAFAPVCTELIQRNIRFALLYPAKLRVHSNGTTTYFTTVAEAQSFLAQEPAAGPSTRAWKDYQYHNKQHEENPVLYWEVAKAVLRGVIISYVSRVRKTRDRELLRLSDLMMRARRTFALRPTSENRQSLLSLQAAVNALLHQRATKSLAYYKYRLYVHGNKGGKLLARLISQRESRKKILHLHTVESGRVTSDADICEVLRRFYATLYAPPPDLGLSGDLYLEGLDLPCLSEEQTGQLNAPIEVEEVELAIAQSPTLKAPGVDGYRAEFYKLLQSEIGSPLAHMFNVMINAEAMPEHLNVAQIIVLPKPGRDPTLPESYRPISLLNFDVKLLARILANRLARVLPLLLHESQVGFVKGRSVAKNLRRILISLEYASRVAAPSLLISFDAEKAFDRVRWDFLFATLDKYGFGGRFVSALRALYASPQASVWVNGCRSSLFEIHTGTRQGCPLSPLLFVLTLDPLLRDIYSNPTIRGIQLGDQSFKVAAFADDLLAFLTDPSSSLQALLETMREYGDYAGFRLNLLKSEALPSSQALQARWGASFPLRWAQGSFRYLGVYISVSTSQLYSLNIPKLLADTKVQLEAWEGLPLTLLGRISLVRMVIFPRWLYVMQTLPLRLLKKDVNGLYRLLSRFCWNSRKPKVRLSYLVGGWRQGGLGLPDFGLYNEACLLRHLKDWLLDEHQYTPLDFERAFYAPHTLNSLLHLPATDLPPEFRFDKPQLQHQSLVVELTLKKCTSSVLCHQGVKGKKLEVQGFLFYTTKFLFYGVINYRRCIGSRNKTEFNEGVRVMANLGSCGFCHQREQNKSTGRLYKTPDGELCAHYKCMLFSSDLVTQNSPDLNDFGGFHLEDIRKEVERGQKLKCSKCKAKGATIGCDIKICRRTYHYLCALKCKAEIVEEEENGIFKIYCYYHRRNYSEVPSDNDDNIDETLAEDEDDDDDDNNYFLLTVDTEEDGFQDDVCFKEQESMNEIKVIRSTVKQMKIEIPAAADGKDSQETLDAAISTVIPQENDKGAPGTKRKQKTKHSNSASAEKCISHLYSRNLEFRDEGPPKKQAKLTTPGTSENSNQNNSFNWTNLIASLASRIGQLKDSDINGQRTATVFWKLCREANCTESVISKIKTSFEFLIQKISSEIASDEDYHQVFQVLLATDCLKDAILDAKQEITDAIQILDERKALLCKEEKILGALTNHSD
uniref:Histone-lysine N-methyltransferase SETDB2 n=1 Tax=Geotrypetes seraphini TaxID=260995 RepID=A0A6P8RKU0_GEOSA|nr:histone-lysine N-methyltransferase SETDB2 [Geotrypetes seraphini]